MTVKTFAAIDVGSFELELGIFEISASAGIREIDHVRHALALGKDTYNDGRLSHEIVEEMCEVLNKFREVMKTYRVSDYRAFASSALREARNSQMVLDRILVRTGLRVRTMNNSELRFKSYKAVAARGGRIPAHREKRRGVDGCRIRKHPDLLFDEEYWYRRRTFCSACCA